MPQLVWQKAETSQDIWYDFFQTLVWYFLEQASNSLQHHAVHPLDEAVGPRVLGKYQGMMNS